MDGLILVDKPPGMTSHDVVIRIRAILNQQRVGHFGTLDPLATGLLLIAVGRAVRLFPYFSKEDKAYDGEIRLGFSTDTYDATGKPTSEKNQCLPDRCTLIEAMKKLTGRTDQVPPPFSAKKLGGKPLYKWARARKPVALKPSSVLIHAFDLIAYRPPSLSFELRCSSGTYVRSVAHELGQSLGCGAHLAGLRRLSVGRHTLTETHSLQQVERLAREGKTESFLLPLEALLPEFPTAILSPSGLGRLQKGKYLPSEQILRMIESRAGGPEEICRLFSPEGRFLGLAKPCPDRAGLVPFVLLT